MSGLGKILQPIESMLGLHKEKKSDPAPSAPSAPGAGDAAVQAAAEEERRKRGNAGRASTIIAGDDVLGQTGSTSARKTLMGQ